MRLGMLLRYNVTTLRGTRLLEAERWVKIRCGAVRPMHDAVTPTDWILARKTRIQGGGRKSCRGGARPLARR